MASASSPTGSPRSAHPVGYHRFHPDDGLNFQLNRFWTFTGGELPADELRDVAAGIADYAAWVRDLTEFAGRLEQENRLRAAAFVLRMADFFVSPGDPRREEMRGRFIELVRAVHGLGASDVEAVPYDGASLPAYRMSAKDPRVTLVTFGGFDSYVEEWLDVMAFAARAGAEIIAFDGPGQGGALEDGGLKMTTEWHRPVGAVLDHFACREATIVGISLGGCLAIRAAAREPRATAVICDDVMTDFRACMLAQAPPARQRAMQVGRFAPAAAVDAIASRMMKSDLMMQWGIGQAEHVFGVRGTKAVMREAARYNTRDVSADVTQDVLLFAAADDHYVPVSQLAEQVDLLRAARSVTARVFTEADNAGNHCHIGNFGLSLEVMFEWVESLARQRGEL